MKKITILIILFLVGVFTVVGFLSIQKFSKNLFKEGSNKDLVLRIETNQQFKSNEPFNVTVSLKNTGSKTVTLDFRSSNEFSLKAIGSDGKEAYRSNDIGAAILMPIDLEPSESIEEQYELTLPSGSYELIGKSAAKNLAGLEARYKIVVSK